MKCMSFACNLTKYPYTDRVGGRTLTVPVEVENGTEFFDMGGQWVGAAQPHVMGLIKELGLQTYPQQVFHYLLLLLTNS